MLTMPYIDLQMVLGFQPHSSLLPLTVKPRARPKFYKQSSFFHIAHPPAVAPHLVVVSSGLWFPLLFPPSTLFCLYSVFQKWAVSSHLCAPICQRHSCHQAFAVWCLFIYLFIYLLFFCLVFIVPFISVAQSHPTLCDSMNHSTPGLPVHHQLPESTQTHVHWVSDAILPSHPLSSPSLPALNLSQHQGLFQWVLSSPKVAKVL